MSSTELSRDMLGESNKTGERSRARENGNGEGQTIRPRTNRIQQDATTNSAGVVAMKTVSIWCNGSEKTSQEAPSKRSLLQKWKSSQLYMEIVVTILLCVNCAVHVLCMQNRTCAGHERTLKRSERKDTSIQDVSSTVSTCQCSRGLVIVLTALLHPSKKFDEVSSHIIGRAKEEEKILKS
jgi:hypothetical protein